LKDTMKSSKRIIERTAVFLLSYTIITILLWAIIYLIMSISRVFGLNLFTAIEGTNHLFIFFVATFILNIQFYKELDKQTNEF